MHWNVLLALKSMKMSTLSFYSSLMRQFLSVESGKTCVLNIRSLRTCRCRSIASRPCQAPSSFTSPSRISLAQFADVLVWEPRRRPCPRVKEHSWALPASCALPMSLSTTAMHNGFNPSINTLTRTKPVVLGTTADVCRNESGIALIRWLHEKVVYHVRIGGKFYRASLSYNLTHNRFSCCLLWQIVWRRGSLEDKGDRLSGLRAKKGWLLRSADCSSIMHV